MRQKKSDQKNINFQGIISLAHFLTLYVQIFS